MKKTLTFATLLVSLLIDLGLGLGYSTIEVFYVKPTTGPVTECPSGDSPCHPLQYYANHSNFTNNRRFLFLEGEHHLDSVVGIRNVANLSLVGASSGVKILCKSLPSGFRVKAFINLSIENIAISNCSGVENVTLYLVAGSEVSLNHVTISSNLGHDATGLIAVDIVGFFSVFNFTSIEQHGENLKVQVNYSLCNRPSYFNFSHNSLSSELLLGINCSNVHILISDSSFQNDNIIGLNIDFDILTNNSVLVSNTVFKSAISITTCYSNCYESNLHCGHSFLTFDRVTLNSFGLFEIGYLVPTEECTIFIKDSLFSDMSIKKFQDSAFSYVSSQVFFVFGIETILATLQNVTFASNDVEKENYVISLVLGSMLLVNCTFENNIGSVIQADASSKLVFQGVNIFTNNSALVGAGIQLLSSSVMYLQPHSDILFKDNHAEYVGGAIFNDNGLLDPCFFQAKSQSDTIRVTFINNTADFAGSSLYGGMESCCMTISCEAFYDIFEISNTEKDPSAIASDPGEVCFCEDHKHQPNCSFANYAYTIHAFPGEEFPASLAVVGSKIFDGVVPGAIRAYFESSCNATLGLFQSSQTSDKPFCKNFSYSVNSTERKVIFRLASEEIFLEVITRGLAAYLSVTVYLKDCPAGFSLSHNTSGCVCDPVINTDNVKCDINDQTILRPTNTWIGFFSDTPTISNNILLCCFIQTAPLGTACLVMSRLPSTLVIANVSLIALDCCVVSVKMATVSPLATVNVRSAPTLTCSSYSHYQWQESY